MRQYSESTKSKCGLGKVRCLVLPSRSTAAAVFIVCMKVEGAVKAMEVRAVVGTGS